MAIIRAGDEPNFKINVEGLPEGELKLLRFRGREGLSQLFHFEIEAVCEDANLKFDDIVGKAAVIGIAGLEGDRFVHGIVCELEEGIVGDTWTGYRIQFVPRVWRLAQRQNCRIFNDNLTAPDIITKVLDEAGVPSTAYRSSLKANYAAREICVQYNETDWDFCCRLMEEEGIFFFFEHTEKDHVLVLADDRSAHAPITGPKATLPLLDPSSGVPEEEYVGRFRFAQKIRSGAVATTDYNFKRPSTNLDNAKKGDADDDLEVFEYPGRFDTSDVGKRLVDVRLEEHQSIRRVAVGHSVSPRLIPGSKFTLEKHAREDFNVEWLVTEVVHQGSEPSVLGADAAKISAADEPEYTNEFRAIKADVLFRPLRVTPRPQIFGTQTAVVVGPENEEIYTDEHGRVRLKFFWDRFSKADDKASAWVRVAQTMAGAGWGSVFLPRCGQEVLVSFLDGDPDRPVVVGSVYNADQAPPYTLPDAKSKTVFKSSSVGADGFNELRFDDEGGEEQVFLYAQKNMDVRVKEDRYELIEKSSHTKVAEDHVTLIENERHANVKADDVAEVGGDRHLNVKGKQAIEVTGTHSFVVKGDVAEEFKGNHSEKVAMNYFLKGMGVVIEAQSGITLKCGGGSIVIDPSGVTIKGPMMTLDGNMVRIASGPGSPPTPGQAGSVVAPIAPMEALEADEPDPVKTAQLKTQQRQNQKGKYGAIKATPFKRKEEDAEDSTKASIEIELVDEAGEPVAGEKYEVTLPDGKTVAKGTLDANGYAKVSGIDPGNCEVSFPDLDKQSWDPA